MMTPISPEVRALLDVLRSGRRRCDIDVWTFDVSPAERAHDIEALARARGHHVPEGYGDRIVAELRMCAWDELPERVFVDLFEAYPDWHVSAYRNGTRETRTLASSVTGGEQLWRRHVRGEDHGRVVYVGRGTALVAGAERPLPVVHVATGYAFVVFTPASFRDADTWYPRVGPDADEDLDPDDVCDVEEILAFHNDADLDVQMAALAHVRWRRDVWTRSVSLLDTPGAAAALLAALDGPEDDEVGT